MNILVNADMEIDDRHEGQAIMCRNGPGESTEGPNRWFSQLDARNARVCMERRFGDSASGTNSYARFTVLRPADEVVALDRLQLFQPIEPDELNGLTVSSGEEELAGPLEFSFAIRSSIALDVGCTLNSGAAVRNFTTNRHVEPGTWRHVAVSIPRDDRAPWSSGERFGMYFQIGISCGDTRLSRDDGFWNDGHWLMIETPLADTFLRTNGATVDITRCYFGPAREGLVPREPTMLSRLRTQRFIEKSYFTGVRPGTPDTQHGAFGFQASPASNATRIAFQALKLRPSVAHLYSPSSGQEGMAFDQTAGRDVPVGVLEQTPQGMVIAVADPQPGHAYRVHWMVHDFE